MKKVVTIQDISCFGKCSATVALPVISAMGVECAVIPTAVLSTHTGGFKGYTFRDLTDDIPAVTAHWKKEGLCFDGLYTGYLGSPEQAAMIGQFIDEIEPAYVFIDPAMADNGKLYAGFGEEIIGAMKSLCDRADLIVPNLTEATLMLGEEYRASGTYDEAYIHDILRRLAEGGAKIAAVTGVNYDGARQGIVAYHRETGEFEEYFHENLPVSYHGTGDLFASTLFGAIMREKPLAEALRIAATNVLNAIRATMDDPAYRYSVKFELVVPQLLAMLGE
ncbi:MAG: pyridoxamine kinase [Clostridia bacterium]|nr:pyridoxamine kinase [Clostridia bacterium]